MPSPYPERGCQHRILCYENDGVLQERFKKTIRKKIYEATKAQAAEEARAAAQTAAEKRAAGEAQATEEA